jgi:cytochrome c oxidase accessory protein FixG
MTDGTTAAGAAPVQEIALYELQRKIYPRAVSGWFAGWRVALVLATQLAFYGTLWLEWNGRQALLFDLVNRKFYIFGLVLWPQDFIYLTLLLIISALSLFLFTAMGGRLWCGYACPQTVYTEIFLWIERRVEGDRAARMRLDAAPASVEKVLRKTLKHALWIALSLWTGFTFVGYFTPVQQLLGELASWSFGPWEWFWVLFYGFATYGNAGWMREQVCKYMCPYARFQSAMFDQDTMIITYDRSRGEPRGGRSRTVQAADHGLGDCVDCGICVQVCPTGIDIRNGLQYECIGCAACIDGCNQVMQKMHYAPGLIRYSTQNALRHGWSRAQILRRMLRPRILIYGSLLLAVILAGSTALALRVPLKLDVIRDRGAMARELADGQIENVYRLQIMNTRERNTRYALSVSGLPDIALASPQEFEVASASTIAMPVRVRLPAATPGSASRPIHFELHALDDPAVAVREKSVFLLPR